MPQPYKMIAVDMDGTLLQSDKTIHQDSITDIQAVVEKGIQIVYCTGRALLELQSYVEILPMVRYAVCYSGAIVYDYKENRCIFRTEIEQEYIEKIVENGEKYKASLIDFKYFCCRFRYHSPDVWFVRNCAACE